MSTITKMNTSPFIILEHAALDICSLGLRTVQEEVAKLFEPTRKAADDELGEDSSKLYHTLYHYQAVVNDPDILNFPSDLVSWADTLINRSTDQGRTLLLHLSYTPPELDAPVTIVIEADTASWSLLNVRCDRMHGPEGKRKNVTRNYVLSLRDNDEYNKLEEVETILDIRDVLKHLFSVDFITSKED